MSLDPLTAIILALTCVGAWYLICCALILTARGWHGYRRWRRRYERTRQPLRHCDPGDVLTTGGLTARAAGIPISDLPSPAQRQIRRALEQATERTANRQTRLDRWE